MGRGGGFRDLFLGRELNWKNRQNLKSEGEAGGFASPGGRGQNNI